MSKIEIKKQWEGIGDGQCVKNDNGDTWFVVDLIEECKDLEVLEIPLNHLCIDAIVGNGKLRDFASHMKMVMDSSLDYPIILDENGSIFDGRHRVVKALYLGKETIKAVRFDKDPQPRVIR